MAIRIWQSVCLICGLVYKVQLIDVQDSKYNTNGFSTGICPECQQRRKDKRVKALCEKQRRIQLARRLMNQLNYHPDHKRVKEIERQVKAILEYLADDVAFIGKEEK